MKKKKRGDSSLGDDIETESPTKLVDCVLYVSDDDIGIDPQSSQPMNY